MNTLCIMYYVLCTMYYHDGKENDNNDRRLEIVHEKNDRKL